MVSPFYKLWLGIRAAVFWVFFIPGVLFFAVLLVLAFFLPIGVRIGVVKMWIAYTLFFLRVICGLGHRVEGTENIPDHGFIVMSKHSSTWETIALQRLFRPMVWVVKRELTWIPFFGWALKAMNAIALNRGTGRKAINQLVRESKISMDEGRILQIGSPSERRMTWGEEWGMENLSAIASEVGRFSTTRTR